VGNLFPALLPSETAKVRFQWLSGSSYVRSNSEAATKKYFPRLLYPRNGFLRLYSFCHSCPLCHSCESRSPFLSILLPFKEIPAFASMTTGGSQYDNRRGTRHNSKGFPPAGALNDATTQRRNVATIFFSTTQRFFSVNSSPALTFQAMLNRNSMTHTITITQTFQLFCDN
jgi:hypothetical protein